MELYRSHHEEKKFTVINRDLLNKGQEIKISQGEFSMGNGQLPINACRFVTVSPVFSYSPLLVLPNGLPGMVLGSMPNRDFKEMVTHDQNHLQGHIIHNESLNNQRRNGNNKNWYLLRSMRHFIVVA